VANRCVIVLRELWPTGVSLSRENCGQQVCHCPENIVANRCVIVQRELWPTGVSLSRGNCGQQVCHCLERIVANRCVIVPRELLMSYVKKCMLKARTDLLA